LPFKPAGRRHFALRDAVGDLASATFLYLVVTVGFASWYSGQLYERAAFIDLFGHGVYRYRVVGRELVVGADRVLGGANPIARIVVAPPGDLHSAVFVVNGLGFMGFAWLLRAMLGARPDLPADRRHLIYLTVLTVVALSSYVVTPYDMLSYALIMLFLRFVDAPSIARWWSVPVMALAVATRESAFVALAAALASLHLSDITRGDARARARATAVCTSAVAAVGAYGLLHLLLRSGASVVSDGFTFRENLRQGRGLVGLVIAAGGVMVWARGSAVRGIVGASTRRRRRTFLLLSSPYVAVSVLVGLWFELRLVLPVLLGDLWLRVRDGDAQPDAAAGATRGPLTRAP
jgi:hypothetical protein